LTSNWSLTYSFHTSEIILSDFPQSEHLLYSQCSHIYSYVTPVSSTNKTDCRNITEIMLKVALNTINQTLYIYFFSHTLVFKKPRCILFHYFHYNINMLIKTISQSNLWYIQTCHIANIKIYIQVSQFKYRPIVYYLRLITLNGSPNQSIMQCMFWGLAFYSPVKNTFTIVSLH